LSVERANAETGAVATPEIPGGYPALTAWQLDLIRERSTETVVGSGASTGQESISERIIAEWLAEMKLAHSALSPVRWLSPRRWPCG
jgi:hypothetical protein